MKFGDSKADEILVNYYRNTKMPVWIYDKNLQLQFTNFTSAALLHLMDVIEPVAATYRKEATYTDFMKLYGTENEVYLCFQTSLDRWRSYIVVIGPGLLTYPSEEAWRELTFHRHIWSSRRDEALQLIPVITLEGFLSNCRFIMQCFGIYHLDPMQVADTLQRTNYYFSEISQPEYLAAEMQAGLYSVKQAHETENALAYNIRKGQADGVDEILIQQDRISLLLPAESYKDNFVYAIALLSIGRNAAIDGGMRGESAYALFHSYSIQLQSCHQSQEFFRLVHHALCAFAEGVQTVSVQMLECYSDTVRNCIRQIYAHLPGKVTVDELADEIHLTPKYLSALFCKETGTSLTQFINKIRIDQARHMLDSTELTYSEISNVLEFCSQSHFTSTFKKAVGLTPREYRLRTQNG